MHHIKKFYQFVKQRAIRDYLDSRGIVLNRDITNMEISSFGCGPTLKDIQEDKQKKLDAWKHVKQIILWAIPGTLIGVPLAICLIFFLAPVLLCILVYIGIPIGLIWFVVYLILNL